MSQRPGRSRGRPQPRAWGQPQQQQQRPEAPQTPQEQQQPVGQVFAGRYRGRSTVPPTVPQPQTSQPPPPSVWGQKKIGPKDPGPSTSAGAPPGFQAPVHTPTGRGDASSELQAKSAGGAPASGDSKISARGALRGKRRIGEPDRNYLWTRPESCDSKQGTIGQRVLLRANYFKILEKPNFNLYLYRVDFDADEDRTYVKKALIGVHEKKLGAYMFDGSHLYMFKKMNPDNFELFSKRDDDDTIIRIKVKLIQEIRRGDHHYLQIYNIIIRNCMSKLKLVMINRNYFDRAAIINIPQFRIALWPGYITSMRQHDGGVLLCTEIIHRVIRQDMALDIFKDLVGRYRHDCQVHFKRAVVGQVVSTNYANFATYRICDVDFSENPLSTFKWKDNNVTYVHYYKEKYSLRITDMTQPLLLSQSTERQKRSGKDDIIKLIPEFCQMTGYTDDMRANTQLMRKVADNTRIDPRERQQRLLDFNRRFHAVNEINTILSKWELSVDKNLVEVPGRRLDPQIIYYGKDRYGKDITDKPQIPDWIGSLRRSPMRAIAPLDHWAILYWGKFERKVDNFLDLLLKAADNMGFRMAKPERVPMDNDRIQTLHDTLRKVLDKSKPEAIMVIISNHKEKYNLVKKQTIVDRAVPSQVVTDRNLDHKGLFSIATKVAIQVACKIGGAPWGVSIPTCNGIMVAGFDVCHDSSNRSKSFSGFVASINDQITRYYSSVTRHEAGEEISSDLQPKFTAALGMYLKYNKRLPSYIVVYRDGVGEGQVPEVFNHELNGLVSHFKEIYEANKVPEPKVLYIIVTKRINTRIFEGGNNPQPGTVVDDVITCPERYDFFLVSQSVRQGSVSPTGYNIIYDTTKLAPDKIQSLTYKLTHLYFNWCGTVRVPAPCQYAHKLAYLVGQHVGEPCNPQLSNLLYYL